MMSILNLIHNRKSPRAFDDHKITQEQLEMIFEAARWAPSARNEQPWQFKYAFKEDVENYTPMLELLSDWNQQWAHTAPLLVAGITRLTYKHNGTMNEYAWYDLGQSVAYLSLQASEMGISIHQMGGFNREKANQLFQLPENFQVVIMMALGYKGGHTRIPEKYQEAELTKTERKSLDEMFSLHF